MVKRETNVLAGFSFSFIRLSYLWFQKEREKVILLIFCFVVREEEGWVWRKVHFLCFGLRWEVGLRKKRMGGYVWLQCLALEMKFDRFVQETEAIENVSYVFMVEWV